MGLWIALAVMTGAAALALLWPLARRPSPVAATAETGDVAVYRDQLAEVERDRERGLIPAAEAEAARIEIARRLIAADAARPKTAPVASVFRRRAAALAVLLVVPSVALGVYARVGSPSLPDRPLQARLDAPPDTASMEELVGRVEARLAENPSDGEGWELLGPIYLRAGRLADAVQAYANALRLRGPTPQREAALGEAMTVAADNTVTADARAAFQRALALDATEPKARYYLGLAKEQDGDTAGAIADWEALRLTQPVSSPIGAFLRREIARLKAPAQPGPSAADVATANTMTPAERAQMIQGMVQRLAERLDKGGGTLAEWQQLVRAYIVIGQKDKALAALASARKALAASPEAGAALDDLAKGLDLTQDKQG